MSTLNHVTEDWQRALAIVAHPDDMEWGAAAAVARWTGQGKVMTYCMVTSGEAGIDAVAPAEAGPLREREQVDAAQEVGVDEVLFLRRPDGVLEYGLDLRRRICDVVRRYRPEIVITNSFRETWAGGGLNQADHIATGRATLDAVRDAGNRWVFPEQLGADRQPWDGVRQVWLPGSPEARHAVDVTDTFEAGVASLAAHRAYIDGLAQEFDPRAMLDEMGRAAGAQLGVTHAAAIEVLDLS
ncbi:PIG-L deacetylase family protein [Georgenia sp. MJ170]|uniref:PIG-L deacetylase family protein n=1 Tax=Georgenia sunbinii TaxID=3117728 RepID=UPI002F26AA8C